MELEPVLRQKAVDNAVGIPHVAVRRCRRCVCTSDSPRSPSAWRRGSGPAARCRPRTSPPRCERRARAQERGRAGELAAARANPPGPCRSALQSGRQAAGGDGRREAVFSCSRVAPRARAKRLDECLGRRRAGNAVRDDAVLALEGEHSRAGAAPEDAVHGLRVEAERAERALEVSDAGDRSPGSIVRMTGDAFFRALFWGGALALGGDEAGGLVSRTDCSPPRKVTTRASTTSAASTPAASSARGAEALPSAWRTRPAGGQGRARASASGLSAPLALRPARVASPGQTAPSRAPAPPRRSRRP